ncbi:MAG: aminomethyl-transferring glycine dehydrogenase subunit GcvPA [Oscillospiraceae bacterium]|jgi:glycine dehydrogenase subunit 1|nr:aminomethyl-transferring glycine dehydrogenase subunit GcvPA [Oscillospiraceae bacterium]
MGEFRQAQERRCSENAKRSFRYAPITDTIKDEMLSAIGLSSVEELFAGIPGSLKSDGLDLPEGLSELALRRRAESLAAKNKVYPTVLRGMGAYRHYIPSIVKEVPSRATFLTAYTPYQAEVSQGILQAIFEWQSDICRLTDMDASNASVYDGAVAAAEAAAMCVDRGRRTILIADTVFTDTIEVVKTYARATDYPVQTVSVGAISNCQPFASAACLILQSPNKYGIIEDVRSIADACHAAGVKLILSVNPVSLALFKTPGELGADIAVGEAQPFGLPLGFGGPYLGFMACKKDMMRKLPGRIVGETRDAKGNKAYVLTLQAREQHIRRERASSSICTNQALCALTATVYLAYMGKQGLRGVAEQCYAKAHYLKDRLAETGLPLKYEGEFFNEFLTEAPRDINLLLKKLDEAGILGGMPVDGGILWAVTEMNTRDELDKTAAIVKEVIG